MGIDYEDAYAFMVDFFEVFHKMNIVERLSVKFWLTSFRETQNVVIVSCSTPISNGTT